MEFKYLLIMTTTFGSEVISKIATACETMEEAERWAKKFKKSSSEVEGFFRNFYIQEISAVGEKKELNI